MTANQWKLLEILENWGGHGTIEVETQFGGYNFGDTEKGQTQTFRTTRLVVASLMVSLAKRGLATIDENGYDITESGRRTLQNRGVR